MALKETGTFRVKAGLAEMLKGGVIMDVVTAEQAKIAEAAGRRGSWRWSASRPTSGPRAEWRGWRIPRRSRRSSRP